jgi:hypothetical protein
MAEQQRHVLCVRDGRHRTYDVQVRVTCRFHLSPAMLREQSRYKNCLSLNTVIDEVPVVEFDAVKAVKPEPEQKKTS